MNIRTLLSTVACLTLAGCALKIPPFGADIMPESARAKIPGQWAGPHRSGAVVPNWIRTFGDPELTALVAGCRRAESRPESRRRTGGSVTLRDQGRGGVALSAHRNEGSGQPAGAGASVATSVAASIRRASAAYLESTTAAAAASTPAWIHHRSVGSMASASARPGRPTCGAAFARRKRPRRLKATRSRPTMNLPGNRSPPPWRAPIFPPSKPRSRLRTRRRRSIFTRSIRS